VITLCQFRLAPLAHSKNEPSNDGSGIVRCTRVIIDVSSSIGSVFDVKVRLHC